MKYLPLLSLLLVAAVTSGFAADTLRRSSVAEPRSITSHTYFEAEVQMLSREEGGRHTPIFNNYQPRFYFSTTGVTGKVQLPEGTEMVMPGDKTVMTVRLVQPVAMKEGLSFILRDGDRTVGNGRVIKIIE